jgi:hypothetical protein
MLCPFSSPSLSSSSLPFLFLSPLLSETLVSAQMGFYGFRRNGFCRIDVRMGFDGFSSKWVLKYISKWVSMGFVEMDSKEEEQFGP